MSFVPPGMLENLSQMSSDQLNTADFGIVKVDDGGTIQFYNQYESNLAGIPQSDAVGKNFFTQVAVCTNNRLFFGKFKKGVTSGNLNFNFPYTFTYRMKPTNVKIHLYRDAGTRSNWVLVKKA